MTTEREIHTESERRRKRHGATQRKSPVKCWNKHFCTVAGLNFNIWNVFTWKYNKTNKWKSKVMIDIMFERFGGLTVSSKGDLTETVWEPQTKQIVSVREVWQRRGLKARRTPWTDQKLDLVHADGVGAADVIGQPPGRRHDYVWLVGQLQALTHHVCEKRQHRGEAQIPFHNNHLQFLFYQFLQ